MAITYNEHTTRGQPILPSHGFPGHQRAFDYSWFNRGVGKTMRRGNRLSEEVFWARRKLKYRLAEVPEADAEARAALIERFKRKKKHLLRRAHVWWRRGHRVRRAQWAHQNVPIYASIPMLFHYLMQKHHERAFAALSRR